MLPALRCALAIVLASGCVSAASPRSNPAEPTDNLPGHFIMAALPRQWIPRTAVGLPVGARGWATLGGAHVTVFYRLTPAPKEPDVLIVDSPVRDEQAMTRNGDFLGVLQQACEWTGKLDDCTARTTLAVSGDAPAGSDASGFEPVDLLAEAIAEFGCGTPTPRVSSVERARCPGGGPGGPSSCPVAPARDGSYRIGPFRVLIAMAVPFCEE